MRMDPLIILRHSTSGATEQISNLSTGTIKVKRVENEQSLLMAYGLRILVYDEEHDVIL